MPKFVSDELAQRLLDRAAELPPLTDEARNTLRGVLARVDDIDHEGGRRE